MIGLEGFDSETATQIFKTLFEIESNNWPSQIGAHIPKLANALDRLFNVCFEHLKPTPMKVHYTFNLNIIGKNVECLYRYKSLKV